MVRITVHEHKSEAFDYSRASTPVAKAYELLDDYFCDDAGALRKDAVEKIFITFRNEKDLVDRCKSKATKSYSIAWEAFLREIQATLEWDDEFPHATKLSSEQVKKWFASKGRDFKEDLKPLVDAIDKQRKTWDEERASNKGESNKSESFVTDMTKAIQQNKPEVLLSDDAVTYFNDYDAMLDAFEGAYQTVILVNGKHGVEEMMFLYVPDDNIVVIGDFDVYSEDADRAKELMEKFVRGELTKKPGSSDDLENVDYVAIMDGNTYASTVFVEGE